MNRHARRAAATSTAPVAPVATVVPVDFSTVKLCVALSTMRGVHPQCVPWLVQLGMCITQAGGSFGFLSSSVAHIATARGSLALEFLESDFTHFLQIDDDVAANPADIRRMIERGVSAVGLTYRQKERAEVCYSVRFFGEQLKQTASDGVVRAALVPGGCLLLRRDVVEKLRTAHGVYRWGRVSAVGAWLEFVRNGELYAEDYALSARVRDLGIPMLCELSGRTVHYGVDGTPFEGDFAEYWAGIECQRLATGVPGIKQAEAPL